MDIQEFNRQLRQKAAQLNELMRRKMPVLAGNIAKRHIEEDFRKGGFTGGGFHQWQETRRQRSGRSDAASRYGPLLSGRNRLSRSINFRPGDRKVTVYTNVPYAPVHNDGGTTHPNITPKMRRYAWARHYKEAGKDKQADTLWKRLALTKKKQLTIRIPKRQFMPDSGSTELGKKIRAKLEQEVKTIIH